MKIIRFVIILAFSVTIHNCKLKAQKDIETTTRIFDIETFNRNKTGNEYFFVTNDSTNVKQYESNDEYWETLKYKDSLLEDFYEYFKNGKIKRYVKRFPNAFALGKLKEYDEQGNLIKEENLDKPFIYSWGDVKSYLKEHGVEDIQKHVISISRWSDKQETTWTLEFNGKYNTIKGSFVITLNGKTGEELEVKLFKGKDALGETGTIAVYDTIYKK
ncbi:hypothetical protein [Tenacibaculum sp. SDUM215027]|uniref:hypothetical protein n=1 Tax=Tenacibaculum sp. SDUM215027 TaxID=3422596 RepID=UPI003D315962